VAVRRAGLTLEGAALAVTSGSHSGSAEHVALVEQILGGAGLGVDALQCPLAWPSNSTARTAATEQRREYFNCSGKHAAFLAACVGVGWSTHDYLAPEHPLQKLIVDVLEEFAGEKVLHTTVDGCGAPLHTLTVEGLARATGKFALEETEIAAALKANGWAIGDREAADSLMLDAGLVAKVGAEGVYVVGTADGHGLAIKVADGSMRAMAAVAVAILAKHELIGADVAAELSAKVSPRVLGGGADVGRLEVMI
jgi:L-asparaginase II